jgi:hypothetical protein
MIGTFEDDVPVIRHASGGSGSTIAVYRACGLEVQRTAGGVPDGGGKQGVEEWIAMKFIGWG